MADQRVFIIGVARPSGRLLTEHLLAQPEIVAVGGLDDRPCVPPVPGLAFVRSAFDRPEWTAALDGVGVAVVLLGLAWPLRWRDRAAEAQLVAQSKLVLRRLRAAGVRKIIVAQSAALYGTPTGASPDPLTESARVRGHRGSAYARARAQVADFLDLFARDYDGILTRLRAAWIVGPHHLALARLCASEPALACGYEEYMLPVVHEDDLVRALAFAVRHDLPGVYHVGAAEGLRFHEVAALVGKQHACTPLPWLVLRAWVRWRWLRWHTPPLWVRALYRGAGLDVGKLRAAGWSPQVTARAAFNEALDVFRAR